ncbi:MAG: hypothetical protein IH946_06635, partial [Bacteroidetes bacterium]|nr:hypothetical protein [Bacteroidota bacterium]
MLIAHCSLLIDYIDIVIWRYIFIPIALLMYSLGFGQELSYEHFTTNDGLAGNEVYYVFQDSKGYIWFATSTGVSRYNGVEFENFTTDEGLSDNEVFTIHEDSKGRLWFLTFNGKPSYYLDGTIFNEHNEPLLSGLKLEGEMYSFFEDSKGDLWFGGLGLVRLDVDGKIKRFENPIDGDQQLYASYIWESDGNIWIRAWEYYIVIDENDQMEVKDEIEIPPTKGPGLYYTMLKDGRLIHPLKNKILHFGESEERIIYEGETEEESPAIVHLSEDRKSNIWAATYSGALYLEEVHSSARKTMHLLKGKSVGHVLEDLEGNLWFATLEHGVYFSTSRNVISYVRGVNENPGVSCLAADEKNDLWIGFRDGSYCNINVKDFSNYGGDALGTNDRINDILLHSNGSIWMGGSNGLSRHYHGITNRFALVGIKSLVEGEDGNIYIARYNSLIRFDPNVKPLEDPDWNNYINENRVYDQRVICVGKTTNGNILFSTQEGLMQLKDDIVSPFQPDKEWSKQKIVDIESRKELLVIAIDGMGLLILDGDQEFILTKEDGLNSNICRKVHISDGSIWVATNKGVNKIEKENNDFVVTASYDRRDGLLSNECTSVWTIGTTVWVGTISGLSRFEDKMQDDETLPPPVYITAKNTDSSAQLIDGVLTMKYNHSNISLDFIGLCYKCSGDISYRFRLDPEALWEFTDQHSLQFAALDEGLYNFEIQAMNRSGQWSEESAIFSFKVLPPFWQTWWFYTLCSISILLIGYAVHKMVLNLKLRKFRFESI